MARLLLVDDDERLTALLRDYLTPLGHEVHAVHDGGAALRAYRRHRPELVILDVMLPGQDGYAVLAQLRRETEAPVLMLSARGEVADKVAGIEGGGDDYLAKPFEPRELAARIKALLRRARPEAGALSPLTLGTLRLEPSTRAAFIQRRRLSLTTQEYALLALLLRRPGQILERAQILDALAEDDRAESGRSVDQLVTRLRRKLGDDARRPRRLLTVRGAGYLLVDPGSAT